MTVQPWALTQSEFYDISTRFAKEMTELSTIQDEIMAIENSGRQRRFDIVLQYPEPEQAKLADLHRQKNKDLITKIRTVELINHQDLVARALAEGKSVPAKVLQDYPELMPVKEGKDKYDEAYTRLVHLYNATNNQDALELMEVAENAMAPSYRMFDWESWLEQANMLLPPPLPPKTKAEPSTPGPTTQIIPYSPSLRIVNIEALPRGTGAKFLLVIPGEKGEWIAKQWKRQIPKTLNPREALIDFQKPTPSPAKPKVLKSTPLPPDAQNVQTVPFDSQMFECYGKPTGKGFRAYCRRK